MGMEIGEVVEGPLKLLIFTMICQEKKATI